MHHYVVYDFPKLICSHGSLFCPRFGAVLNPAEMSVIEGIGDEVLFVFGAILLFIVLAFAWVSTYVGEVPPIRVIILDHQRWVQILQRLRNTSSAIIRIPIREPQRAGSPPTENQTTSEGSSETTDSREEPSPASSSQAETLLSSGSSSTSDPLVDSGSSPEGVSDDTGDNIRVRVKYLDDRERLLAVSPETTIGELKRSVIWFFFFCLNYFSTQHIYSQLSL